MFEGRTIGSTDLAEQKIMAFQNNPLNLDSRLQITDFGAFKAFATGMWVPLPHADPHARPHPYSRSRFVIYMF